MRIVSLCELPTRSILERLVESPQLDWLVSSVTSAITPKESPIVRPLLTHPNIPFRTSNAVPFNLAKSSLLDSKLEWTVIEVAKLLNNERYWSCWPPSRPIRQLKLMFMVLEWADPFRAEAPLTEGVDYLKHTWQGIMPTSFSRHVFFEVLIKLVKSA